MISISSIAKTRILQVVILSLSHCSFTTCNNKKTENVNCTSEYISITCMTFHFYVIKIELYEVVLIFFSLKLNLHW